ncbi:MAG: SH3 domain-containing protein [Chloroflexi bacterium]|nr:SH3 domain-containing protein [Chloroflexota bacterium]
MSIRRIRNWMICLVIVFALLPMKASAHPLTTLSCTFTAKYPIIVLRSGPGRAYERIGQLYFGETLKIIDQAAGEDGYVWWKAGENKWVRSDLGTSDCPATCGNTICEYGETSSSCSQDCANSASSSQTIISTGEGCKVGDCPSCYKSISCYPACNDCTCWRNENGCVTCHCDYPNGSSGETATSTTSTTSTASACVYASCEACYADFPCWGGECSKKECTLNQYGCPSCTTAP